jgi:hypothetical protein
MFRYTLLAIGLVLVLLVTAACAVNGSPRLTMEDVYRAEMAHHEALVAHNAEMLKLYGATEGP